MSRTPRTGTAILLLLVLVFAGVLAAALSAGDSGAMGVRSESRQRLTKVPRLKPVPSVVKSTTKKKPPKNVKFRGEPMGYAVTGDATTGAGAPGEVIIPGVPGYKWRDGCGPTAVGMVIGYYDGHGWDSLIPGDATTQTVDVDQVMSTHGTAEAPGSYEDYALPIDASTTSVVADRSEAPTGDEHVSNSIADFMQTSWSSKGVRYGGSWSSMVSPGFRTFAAMKYPTATATCTSYAGTSLTWTLVRQEIDAGRPMVFLVDSSGDGITDHFVTVVGYREINGYAEYACWDTWSTTLLRWQQFRAMSSTYSWGVWGGYTFGLSTAAPTPTPTPTPTPSPSPSPADSTAPVTIAAGADDAWHNASVTVTFSATDSGSGVARTEYSLDGGDWTQGTSVTVTVPRKTAVAAVHTLEYRSEDAAGNVEPARFAQVKIDSIKPVTSSNADGVAHVGSYTLLLTGKDADSGVAATYYRIDNGSYVAGTSVVIAKAGRHTVRFYSVDAAGNTESAKSCTVTIK